MWMWECSGYVCHGNTFQQGTTYGKYYLQLCGLWLWSALEEREDFRLSWLCIMNVGWRERNRQYATNLMFIIKLLSQHVSGIIMPIIRRTRVCTAAYGVLHWLWWLWLCGAGTRAVCTVKVTVESSCCVVGVFFMCRDWDWVIVQDVVYDIKLFIVFLFLEVVWLQSIVEKSNGCVFVLCGVVGCVGDGGVCEGWKANRPVSHLCSVPDQEILGPVPPVTETLRADSRAVTCCPEDGRLMFGGWVVVVKELKPTAISIY